MSVDGAVKVYPYLAVAALSRSKGTHLRAYQYWTLARGIDVTGRGIVSRAELQEFAKSIGMTRSAIKRAEASLLECDLAMLVNGNYRLASCENAHILYECYETGTPVLIPLERCSSLHEFSVYCWSAFLRGWRKHSDQHPVSRATLADISGVTIRTQLRYEKDCGVIAATNISGSRKEISKKELLGLQEQFGRKSFRMQFGTKFVWAMQLPNSYTSPLKAAKRGMTRKIARRLSHLFTKKTGRAKADRKSLKQSKVYHDNAKETVKAINGPMAPLRELFHANLHKPIWRWGATIHLWRIYTPFGPVAATC